MGLFSSKKKSDDDSDKSTSDRSSNQPLLPPSAQKSSPPSSPPSRHDSSGTGRGPTPPGGLLPTPEWHNEQKKTGDSRPSPGRPQEPSRASRSAPPGQGSSGSRPSAGTDPTVNLKSQQPSAGSAGSAPITQPANPRAAQAAAVPRREPTKPDPSSSTGGPVRVGLMQLLREAVERGASDLHLSRGVPPTIRLDGYLVPLDYPSLSKEACDKLVTGALTQLQREKFDREWELDFSLDLPDAGRFRVNVHKQRGGTEAAFRVVNDVILPLRRLGLPGVVEEIARKHSGLVLVTGPTGSGKTTTLASIVDQINSERQCMIITVEDPIEYVHKNKRSIIKQRELTSDTLSFPAALRHVLRQDPDVIVIGEMRDLETISTALTAAETGHLVFATLHTPDAAQTVDRMIDVFPPHQQEQARIQVANTIQSIIAQQLIPVPGNRGRVVAVEILIATVAVRKIVRTGKTEQLYTTMQTNWETGMITMDKSLKTLYQQGLISFDDALARCKYPTEFDNL